MIIRRPDDIPSSEITAESVYLGRREFIARAAGLGVAFAGATLLGGLACGTRDAGATDTAGSSDGSPRSDGTVAAQDDKPNSYEEITSYNNFYEFGTDKGDPK